MALLCRALCLLLLTLVADFVLAVAVLLNVCCAVDVSFLAIVALHSPHPPGW